VSNITQARDILVPRNFHHDPIILSSKVKAKVAIQKQKLLKTLEQMCSPSGHCKALERTVAEEPTTINPAIVMTVKAGGT
jgi:hypothetical protein